MNVRARFRGELQDALISVTDDLLDRAVELSSGDKSSRELARLGHPYARRHGSPKLDPAIINDQSGRFRDAWRAMPPSVVGRQAVVTLGNDTPYAPHLFGGTKTMFARPLPDRAAEGLEERVADAIASAMRATLR